ncbi:MAG: 3-hydroxyacyl-CoA dehydrogenase family protein [Candidatus Bathyarchaeota archaeon]|nr:MAG: 3-hydroxyacyl-CoA dehydrogenase family protein [Candidatus Bathyarchaeota archaeon]
MIEDIKRVACVGSGLIGQGWAALFALNGYEVVMQDLSEEKLAEAVERVRGHVDFLVQAELGGSADEEMSRIETTTELSEALRDTDFVQESVYENYDVKKPLYGEMDRIAPAEVIFASSTSGLLMTEIQKAMSVHPERGIVAHPWNPAHLVPLVELCPGELTSKETVDRTYALMEDIGKVPVVLKKEAQGFIANRLSAALWREALNLVETGVASVEDVDRAVKAGPGIRWAIMGPYLTYHLGGGKGGIEYLMRHIGASKASWLETMAKWTVTPESAIEKAVEGVDEMVGDKTLEELEGWRDRHLIALYNLLWKK